MFWRYTLRASVAAKINITEKYTLSTVYNVYLTRQALSVNKRLDDYVSVAQAIAKLLDPHAEVIIHDLASGKIAHIFNVFSQRRVGDSSLTDIHDGASFDEDVSGPYRKVNFDRRQLRSVTAVLRDPEGTRIGLLCINFDITIMSGMAEMAASFLGLETTVEKPAALFATDFQESANSIMDGYLKARNVTLASLTSDEMVGLIAQMDKAGVFALRNATNYICELLSLSRATVYKYLKRARAATVEGL
ncbi:helix-turn-helix transcriptional regulator [Pseudomonas sp. PWP3-1b2]|uniref:helix-turn-helix transcriptional regulator n=1 Tax=Pseudomonas sp. PWP3-1b2 TaxID=2804656 RepID=UPI003CE84CFE